MGLKAELPPAINGALDEAGDAAELVVAQAAKTASKMRKAAEDDRTRRITARVTPDEFAFFERVRRQLSVDTDVTMTTEMAVLAFAKMYAEQRGLSGPMPEIKARPMGRPAKKR